jgi:hypothetical protein
MKYLDWLAGEILGKQHEGSQCLSPEEIFDCAEAIIKRRNESICGSLPDMNVGMSDFDYFMAKAPLRFDNWCGHQAYSWASDMLRESEKRRYETINH